MLERGKEDRGEEMRGEWEGWEVYGGRHLEFIQTWVMIKVLGLDSISKDMSIAKTKMTLAERRITKEVRAAKEAGGQNQSDAITKTCEKLREVSRDWCETSQNEDLGLRKKKTETFGCGTHWIFS